MMDIQALAEQYEGASLAKLIEKQVRSLSKQQLLTAIQGTYAKFPEQFRMTADSFSLTYPQENWFGQRMIAPVLSELFVVALHDGKAFAQQEGVSLSDEQAFHLFNLAVMRVAYFAHEHPDFRRSNGIKKGWFR